MSLFFATFEDVAITAAQDVFELVAPAGTKVAIHEILLGQTTDFGDAQAELLSIKLIRGHTSAGSAGSSVTPATRSGHTAATAAASTVSANNTTIASGGSPETMVSDSFNVAAGLVYRPRLFEHPDYDERIVIPAGDRFVARINAPADSITFNGTLIFEEIGIDRGKDF